MAKVLEFTATLALILVSALARSDDSANVDQRSLTREDLAHWLDGYLPSALRQSDIAGAVVVVVKDDAVLLQKGYGYSDVETRTRVDPERTLLRAASISKLFAATAAMQLVESGRLALDRDVNEYLDFKIPERYGRPITLQHLLTHTAGFADYQKGKTPIDLEWYVPLERALKDNIPERIYPPGEVAAYSNYGMGLVGYIVQRISGMEYEDYGQRYILDPLRMRRATFRQPVPEPLRADLSKAYFVASGAAQPFEMTTTRASGALSLTGADMAHFMIAHLQGGRFGDRQVLSSSTVERMHSVSFAPVGGVNGMCLGFFQLDRNGRRIVGHDGDLKGFHGELQLLLDEHVGIFVAFNSDGREHAVYGLRENLLRDFTDRYFPPTKRIDAPVLATAAEHARLMAGDYESSRRLTGILSMFMLFNKISVRDNGDGTISVPLPPSPEPVRLQEVKPFLWQEVGGDRRLGAQVRDGSIQTLYHHPVGAYVPVAVHRSSAVWFPALIFVSVALLTAVLSWPIAALVRHRYSRRLDFSRREMLGKRLMMLGAFAGLLFIVGWLVVAANLTSHLYAFNSGLDPWLRLLQLIGAASAIGVLGAISSIRAGRQNGRPLWIQVVRSLVLIALILLLVYAVVFSLFSLRLRY